MFRTSSFLLDIVPTYVLSLLTQSGIRDRWREFTLTVNDAYLSLIQLFWDLGKWGWLWLGAGVWLGFMYVWVRDFPDAFRLIYYIGMVAYLVSVIFLFIYRPFT